MPHDRLDYRSVFSIPRKHPKRFISHVITAAGLCMVAMYVDRRLRFDGDDARHLPAIEMALIIYGVTFLVLSIARGGLKNRDRLALMICFALFLWTAYIATVMPRGIHN